MEQMILCNRKGTLSQRLNLNLRQLELFKPIVEIYQLAQRHEHALFHGRGFVFFLFLGQQQLTRLHLTPLHTFKSRPTFRQDIVVIQYAKSSVGIILIGPEIDINPLLCLLHLLLDYIHSQLQTLLSPQDSLACFILEKVARDQSFTMSQLLLYLFLQLLQSFSYKF